MTNQVSLTISKILNWSTQQNSCRVEIAFYGVTTGTYLSHKTTLGYSSSQAFILNTSFKISYNSTEHIINCKITNLEGRNGQEIVGNVQVNLNLLKQRSLLFIPFQDHDKVLQVKLYEPKKQLDENVQVKNKQEREQFLQQRYAFMDRIATHESDLKKKFSERVYSFLKQLKNRNVADHIPNRQTPNPQFDTTKSAKLKNQLQFRSRLNDERKRFDVRNTEVFSNQDTRFKGSPIKRKSEENLLLESMKEKSPRDKKQRDYPYPQIQLERQYLREDRYLTRPEKNDLDINSKRQGAFGGILDRQHYQIE